MKARQIQINGRYVARVSGQMAVVEILGTVTSYDYRGNLRTHYHARNLLSGRAITIRSAAGLRYEATPGHLAMLQRHRQEASHAV
jgi:hypothetical protein